MKLLHVLLVFCFSLLSAAAYGQGNASEDPGISIKLDARFDGEMTKGEEETDGGFVGRYLKLLINGRINEKFSYSFRHRLYVDHQNPKSFFNATDWANVTYHHNEKLSITAGKQMVCIGTIEYDYAPIDVYFASDFWNHVSPFQIGVNVGFAPDKNNKFFIQMTNSPFSTRELENIYAYNVIWYGKVAGWYSTIWSANMIEYQKGHFINYIALGNKFEPCHRLEMDLDYMNRYAGKGTAFLEDFSLHGRVSYAVSESVNLFAKGGYDVNRAQDVSAGFVYDRYVLPGVDLGFYGAGMEYFPIKDARQSLRLHAFWYSNTSDPVPHTFNIGVRWQMKVLER
ncbi:MAG: hypothetical protein IJ383_02205 [Bacteroidales bacterium]|nr:hypothetical protein [Bacteroidales bacterium]